jgi:hypothetical protein
MNTLPAIQPEYRALMMFDKLPEGCIAHLVTDSYSIPHIRPGEFVVVDTNDRQVGHLETYVIEWNNGSRNVCEAVSREFNWCDKSIPRRGWEVRSISGLRGKAAIQAIEDATANSVGVVELRGLAWCDGPFRSDDGYLESRLVGCVIGLYAPKAEGPVRTVGGIHHG